MISPTSIAQMAANHYGRSFSASDITFGKWDSRGRRMVFAGSLYIGAIDERTNTMVFNRRAN